MNDDFIDKARKAMKALMNKAMKSTSEEKVMRAIFNAKYVADYRTKLSLWRSRWLRGWLITGQIASLVGFISWAVVMLLRNKYLIQTNNTIEIALLLLAGFSTITVMICAAGMASIGKTPKLHELL